MENAWRKGTPVQDLADRNSGGPALGALGSSTNPSKLYFCVIDRLTYANLDAALAHMRIQHGAVTRGELLVRTMMFGGAR